MYQFDHQKKKKKKKNAVTSRVCRFAYPHDCDHCSVGKIPDLWSVILWNLRMDMDVDETSKSKGIDFELFDLLSYLGFWVFVN